MKALLCKTQALLLLSVLSCTWAHGQEMTKTVKKEFATNSSTVLSMETKFSELKVETWNKNVAAFEVTITADHKDADKAQKLLDLLSVDFREEGNKIMVSTEIDNRFNKIDWGKSRELKFIIKATIPSGIGFELKNNFGSVEIGLLTGKVSIENNYGSLAIQSLDGDDNELELNYGEVRIGRLGTASVELNYGDLTITEANNLDVEVNFGNCTIKKARDIKAEVNMGDLKIYEVSADFKLIDLETGVGSIELGISKSAGFILNAEMNMGSIKTPDLDNKEVRKNGMGQSVKGTYGNGKSVVNASGNMGSIEITLK